MCIWVSHIYCTKISQPSSWILFSRYTHNWPPLIHLNRGIHVFCTMLKFVTASAAEAELGTLFLNAKDAKIMQLTLDEFCHTQSPTPIHDNNSTTAWHCKLCNQMPNILQYGNEVFLAARRQTAQPLHFPPPPMSRKPCWLPHQSTWCSTASTHEANVYPYGQFSFMCKMCYDT